MKEEREVEAEDVIAVEVNHITDIKTGQRVVKEIEEEVGQTIEKRTVGDEAYLDQGNQEMTNIPS